MADSSGGGAGTPPKAGEHAALAPPGAPPGGAIDPIAIIRSRRYIGALVLAAIVGIPVSVIAYGFLALVAAIQKFLFTALPNQIFSTPAPAWWPVPWLVLSGLLTALTIRYLPGNGGHSPAFGFVAGGGPPIRRELPGIALAALTTLSLGAVLGPEAPLIAIGGGLGALAVSLARKNAPPMALTIMASAGSFAAVSTLLGSPVLGAFLIMEIAGIGGAALSLVALPGLLASGIGALVFVGMNKWTGLGTFSLALPSVPPGVPPTLATMGWALVMGAVGALLAWLIRSLALWLRPIVHVNRLLVTSALGLLIGLIAMGYQLVSGRSFAEVLFSGQDALPELVGGAAGASLGVMILLVICKSLAYGMSLSAFRGGPVFPSMFMGAAVGIAASGLPGMDLAPAIGMGIGAMCSAMLRLPLTSTLLAVLLMGPDQVRCLLARSRRLANDLPTVWEAFRRGELDGDQIRVIDRVGRRVTEAGTLTALDDQAVQAAQSRSPKQLQVWLLRLVVQLEPHAFAQRHRRALAERRVTIVQGADGIGYVTGEVSAADAAAIDAMLVATARSLGADDPRTEQQRRADLLLGRLAYDHDTENEEGKAEVDAAEEDGLPWTGATESECLEVEHIDPDTGELLGTQLQRINPDGEPVGDPIGPMSGDIPARPATLINRPRTIRIGIVVPCASLLGATSSPSELADRSGFIPGSMLRDLIAESLDTDSRTEVLFTRLLTDNGRRLLDITELGRYPSRRLAEAIKIRAGTCRYPTCAVPADRCDLDHHQPVPQGATSATNMDPFCRRHHRAKTFAWQAALRDHDGIDWTIPTADHYRCLDEPLPTGRAASPDSLSAPDEMNAVYGAADSCVARTSQDAPAAAPSRDYIERASYTSTLPPSVSTGQPFAFAAASARDAALMIE